MKLSGLKGVFLLLLLCCPAAAARAAGSGDKGGLRFVDLTDDFDRVWSETKDLPGDRRVEEFEVNPLVHEILAKMAACPAGG